MHISRNDVRAAFHVTLPIMVTFIVLGTGFGLLMQKHGFGPFWSVLSGLVILSGTVQFVSVGMLGSGSILMAAVTALMVSARHSFFSISMISRYKDEGRRKWFLYYALCDETYAVLSSGEAPEGVNESAYRFLVTLFDMSAWIVGSFLGGLLGTMLEFDSTGIDFAMTALFTTVFIQQWLDSKCHIPAVLGLGATLACRFAFGPDIFLIPSMLIILTVLTIMRKTIEERMTDSADAGISSGGAGGSCAQREDVLHGSVADQRAQMEAVMCESEETGALRWKPLCARVRETDALRWKP